LTHSSIPNALLLISSHCVHCHALEILLHERKNKGLIGELDIINVEQSPETAQQYGVRSVPWLRLGNFIFNEGLSPVDLDQWIEHAKAGSGQSQYIAYLLEHGNLVKAIEWIEKGNTTLQAVIPLIADQDARINVRVGVGAILEHFEGMPEVREIIPELIGLMQSENPSIRTDACHYLSLSHSMDVIESLKKMLDDEDEQVRQVARESIETLRG
jgi:glutaredoxin